MGPAVKRAVVSDDDASGHNSSLHIEQKGVVQMIDIIRNFQLPGRTVVDLCAAPFATAQACLMVPRNHHFLGCKIDIVFFKESLLDFIEVEAK